MDKKLVSGYTRSINAGWVPLVLVVIFTALLYTSYFILLPQDLKLDSLKVSDFATQYGLYLPGVFALLVLIKSYFWFVILYMIRLGKWWARCVLYLMIYAGMTAIGVQLVYFEPRYTDIAVWIIDTYSMPLLIASGVTTIVVIILSSIKQKLS